MRVSFSKQDSGIYVIIIITAAILVTATFATLALTSGTNEQRLRVVASFYPIWFFSSEIGGEKANVEILIPDNAEPHSWQPSPSDLIKVSEAKMFVYNGAGFEPWADDFIAQISDPNVIIIDSSKNITQIIVAGSFEDPHFWLDPLNAKIQAENILAGYLSADPANATYYRNNEQDLEARLADLNEKFQVGLANRTKNAIVTTHEGFGYLAHRYNFHAYAAIGISADQLPSAQDLADLVQLIRDLGLNYVFAEPIFSDAIIETVAQETGAQVLILDGIHGRTGIHSHLDYFGIMYENLKNLKIGLEVST